MEILAFMRIPAKLNAYSAGNPQHSGNKKSFSHANCPEVFIREAANPGHLTCYFPPDPCDAPPEAPTCGSISM